MPESQTASDVLGEHWFHDGGNTCECGYWAELDSVKRHHIEDALTEALIARETESDHTEPCEHDTLGCGRREEHGAHAKVGDGRPCCGWPPRCRNDAAEARILELVEADAALIRMARNDALRRAADALEAQPPKLKAQYVATLRLYADEPERLGLSLPPGCTCSGGTESNVVCPVHVIPPGQQSGGAPS